MERIEALLEEVRSDPRISETERTEQLEVLQQAARSLQNASEYRERTEAFKTAVESGPQELQRLEGELNTLQKKKRRSAELPEETRQLREAIDSLRAELTLARNEQAQVVKDLNDLARSLEQAVDRMPEAETELARLREALATSKRPTNRRAAAERLQTRAKAQELSAELNMWANARLSGPKRQELLSKRKALLEARTLGLTKRLESLESALEERMTSAAEEIRASLRALIGQWPQLAAEHRDDLAEVAVWAETMEVVAEATVGAKKRQSSLKEESTRISRDWDNIKEQLELGLEGRDIVQVIFSLGQRCRSALKKLQTSAVEPLAEARVGAMRIRQRVREKGADPQDVAPDPLAEELKLLRSQVLVELREEQDRLVRALVALRAEEDQLRALVESVRAYINEQLFGLGFRSATPLGWDTFKTLPEAVLWWAQPAHAQEFVRTTSALAVQIPGWTGFVALFSLGLLGLRRMLIRALEATALPLRRATTDHYGATFLGLGYSVLLALPFPAALTFLGRNLTEGPSPSDWMWGFAAGLSYAGAILGCGLALRTVLRPGGVGMAHFGWKPEPTQRLWRDSGRVLGLFVPTLVVTISCSFGDASRCFSDLGRISFLTGQLGLAFITWRLLHRRDGIVALPGTPAIVVSWRVLWMAVGLAVPLCLVGLAVMGYLITALILSLGWIASLGILTLGAVLHGLALRWFNMRQRRIAVSEALERRRARRLAEAEAEDASEGIELEDPGPRLSVVTQQTRDLLRAVFGVGTLLAVVLYWSASHPVVQVFGGFKLDEGGLTLFQLSWSVLVALVTLVLVRNLPGFLELAIFRTSKVQAGTRAAIYKLGQYGVSVVGAAVALDSLQIDWEQFGWIAAALSVGLGFGLQEVVANFVCGIILLFERPIRIGDIVTVEGVTGTVHKIQMRSTTIVNWDRQELVVPNKTLITSTLLNWTLSASVNRVVIQVGVAYGSDVQTALDILVDAAKSNPRVLRDPAPFATFEQFGDSSLSLCLRAFLPDIDCRLAVISEIHHEVNRRFAAQGIEIAFPQRDLHIRSGLERLAQMKEPLAASAPRRSGT